MDEGRPRRHCPHLGLKHTKAIRFSSPTEEHRCYIFGDPLPIEVDQQKFCLSEGYVNCPRFTGAEPPPLDTLQHAAGERGTARSTASRQRRPRQPSALALFWQQLSPVNRALYLSLVGFLLLILIAYGVIIGIVLPARDGSGTPTPAATAIPPTSPGATSPLVAPTHTQAPTSVIQPVTQPPTSPPTSGTRPATIVPGSPLPTEPTASPPTDTPAAPTHTSVPPTPQPTDTPVIVPPTSTAVPPTPYPSSTPATDTWSVLYFLDASGTYYVPVTRRSDYTPQIARRAVEEMIAGPRSGSNLLRTIPAGMDLLDIWIEGSTIYVDFDQSFEALGAGSKEAMAVVLALTEFSTVDQVQFQVNGTNVGLPGSGNTNPVGRPAYVNFENSYGLEPGTDVIHLELYFVTADGQHLFPLVRRVPFTLGTARSTIDEMIQGHSNQLARSPLPGDLSILSIDRVGDTIVVDFSAAFWSVDQGLATDALALAMTSLTPGSYQGVTAVQIWVQGGLVGTFGRPWINPE
ncbi:MAG: GerMN domain-containing protein [Chloroflexia bacterium]|nr:GerMN domain-containing protein [Chloroflexia bacterium]